MKIGIWSTAPRANPQTFDHMIYDANWDVVQDARPVKTLQGATMAIWKMNA